MRRPLVRAPVPAYPARWRSRPPGAHGSPSGPVGGPWRVPSRVDGHAQRRGSGRSGPGRRRRGRPRDGGHRGRGGAARRAGGRGGHARPEPHGARLDRRRGVPRRAQARHRPADRLPRPDLVGHRGLGRRDRRRPHALALRLGGRPADRSHPYGHRRAENLAALGEAAILAGGGIFVLVEAISRLTGGGETPEPDWYLFAVIGVALLIDSQPHDGLAAHRAPYRSAALRSNAFHFAGDMAGSLAVLAGFSLSTRASTRATRSRRSSSRRSSSRPRCG